MTNEPTEPAPWLSSKETRRQLRISTCKLMHLREDGALRFQKQGNSILYSSQDVARLRNAPDAKPPGHLRD